MDFFNNLTTFQQARVKLTLYYLLGLTTIIILFTIITFDAKESSFIKVRNAVGQVVQEDNAVTQFQQAFDESNQTFRRCLILADIIAISAAALLSWWISGKTLTPIKKMVEYQRNFAADASHELRTPLANIQLEIETTQRLQKIPKSINQLLISISEEVTRMTHMVQGLLLIVRSNQISDTSSFAPIKLKPVISRAASAMTPLAQQKQIQIQTTFHRSPTIMGDSEQLLQVILILIDNAIKYSPSQTQIKVRLSSDNSAALIEVIDHGEGIPEDEQEVIFDRFYRANSLGKSKAKGSGLGLAIAYRIVTSHDGTLTMVSKPQLGTTFTIRIPLN